MAGHRSHLEADWALTYESDGVAVRVLVLLNDSPVLPPHKQLF
jgi:hypothetical protein